MEQSTQQISALLEGRHQNPFELLGPHQVCEQGKRVTAVRAFLPNHQQAWVVDQAHQQTRPMKQIHPDGLFEAIVPPADGPQQASRYMIQTTDTCGELVTMHDPYAFDSLWSEYDLHLFGEGNHGHLYSRLGAQLRTVDGVRGTNFSVWAPNAEGLSVVGDFNAWDGRQHPLRKHTPSGVWELFVPALAEGTKYKFHIRSKAGQILEKSDPFAFAAELPPRTASIVGNLDRYTWCDDQWIRQRQQTNLLQSPISIYEVHLGSWRRDDSRQHGWLNYRDLAHQLVDYCKQMNYTHIELLPISEHPFTGSWGYQTVGYFGVTSRYGTPEDFMYFVDYCHQHELGVILDWVPAHFPRDGHGLRQFDGTALYEHADPRQGEHPDWGTLIFNYGRDEVRNFLIANALFWLDKYHIDGLRVDAVASMLYLDYSREDGEWVPNEHGGRENLQAISLIKEFNAKAHGRFPGVLTIAEESTAWEGVSRPVDMGGLGFSLKWNMGWMNDTLGYMRNDPIHRQFHHDELSFSLIYAFHENFTLPLSHDEVVHGKGSLLDQMPGDLWQKFANLRLMYSYMWTHPGKKLLFMGCDIAQWNEWNCDTNLQWDLLQWPSHQGIQKLIADLNHLHRSEPALHERDFDAGGFEWVDCHSNNESVLSYIRKANDPQDTVLVCCNFTPVVRPYRCGVARAGWYRELLSSDSKHYDGTNVGNHPGVQAQQVAHHGRPWSIDMTLPPLAVCIFKPT